MLAPPLVMHVVEQPSLPLALSLLYLFDLDLTNVHTHEAWE